MPPTDTSEAGLEILIVRHLTGTDGLPESATATMAETPDAVAAAKAGGSGWFAGDPKDYERAYALDLTQLFAFLQATQPENLKKLGIDDYRKSSDVERQKFLARLSSEIGKRGVIDVLRKGIDHGPLHFDLFFGTPSPGNATAASRFAHNRFSISRQLRYSLDQDVFARQIEAAVSAVLQKGLRTSDIAEKGEPVIGTRAMGDAVVAALG